MKIDFNKNADKLVPAIIQDKSTGKVLMLGYMNQEAWDKTLATRRVTFFSRSKNRLWTKGEESGNYLDLISYTVDCDKDTLLLSVKPNGPVCHTGSDTCWGEENRGGYGFLSRLEGIIRSRQQEGDTGGSYVASLFSDGIQKIAQKVGEEAVETILEAKGDDDQSFLEEGADLLFHFLVLLRAKGFEVNDIANVLEQRHRN